MAEKEEYEEKLKGLEAVCNSITQKKTRGEGCMPGGMPDVMPRGMPPDMGGAAFPGGAGASTPQAEGADSGSN